MSESPIKLLILDVDGVLTDGTVFFDDQGRQMRGFSIHDGLGIAMWRAVGGQAAILTSKRPESILARARMLGIDLVEAGEDDKLPGFHRLLEQAGVGASETAYIGDDLLDAPVLRRVGYPVTVPGAPEEVRRLAKLVTSRGGGRGAVREAIEHLLRRQGLWERAVAAVGADR